MVESTNILPISFCVGSFLDVIRDRVIHVEIKMCLYTKSEIKYFHFRRRLSC